MIAEENFMADLIESATAVLELGCGVGRSILPFIDKYPDKYFVGVDIAPYQISLFEQQIRQRNATNVHALVADASDLHSISDKFDLVLICNHTFGNFLGEKRIGVLNEIDRLLTDNGVLMIGGFTNLGMAEECYHEWGVKIQNIDYTSGFIELEHYNSFWQSEESVMRELLDFNLLCKRTRYIKLGYIKAFQKCDNKE